MNAIVKLGFTLVGRKFGLVVQPYDIELRLGSLVITVLWGRMPGDGGLFIEGPGWCWHRAWDGPVTMSRHEATEACA